MSRLLSADMKPPHPSRRSACILLLTVLLASCSPTAAAPFVKISDHPTSVLTAYPSLHAITKIQNKLYFSYGDWNDYPVVVLVAYDPSLNRWELVHSVSSDSVEMIKEINGSIYVPSCDPAHYEDGHDYSVRDPDGRWRRVLSIGNTHSFDFAQTSFGLYSSAGRVWHRPTGLGTWSALSGTFSDTYWCFELNDQIFTYARKTVGTISTDTSLMASTFNHTTKILNSGGQQFIFGLQGKTPGIAAFTSSNLVRFDGNTSTTILSNARGFGRDGDVLYAVPSSPLNVVNRYSNPTASGVPVATPIGYLSLPSSGITCMAVHAGRFYFGSPNGAFYVANADATDITLPAPTTVNLMPDSFGRALALSGDRLLVGAPDALQVYPLAGQAEFWSHETGAWVEGTNFVPSVPDFSGWFGKDVAHSGDLLAIVESGHDLSNRDRGANAKVHVWQEVGNVWQLRSSLALPFAHTAAFTTGHLLVGTSNPAANQDPGKPGIKPYAISRNTQGLASFTGQNQLQPVSTAYGYKAVARVCPVGNYCIAGYSGDVTRPNTGMISVHTLSGGSYLTVPTQEIAKTTAERFGNSLSAYDGFLAVGAPLDDVGAVNSGSVYLYGISPSGTPLTELQKIPCPNPETGAEFGYSVALHDGFLLVGCPNRKVNGLADRGAVYKYRRQPSGVWMLEGELAPPSASITEFGIEVACSESWLAAGSMECALGAEGLTERVALERYLPASAYARWIARYSSTYQKLGGEDPERDGIENLIEYVSNTNPLSAASAPAGLDVESQPSGMPVLTSDPENGMVHFTFVRPSNDPLLVLTVETSANLIDWAPEPAPPAVVEMGTTHSLMRVSVPFGGLKFWRLRVGYPSPVM